MAQVAPRSTVEKLSKSEPFHNVGEVSQPQAVIIALGRTPEVNY